MNSVLPAPRGRSQLRLLLMLLLTVLFSGCMNLRPDFDPPTVTVQSLRVVPGDGIAPGFEIGLRIVNPNRDELKIKGLAYNLAVEDRPLLSGVGKDLPAIPGYSEDIITVSAGASFYEALRLMNDLALRPKQQLSYELQTKLDLGTLYPPVRVTQKGEFNFSELVVPQ